LPPREVLARELQRTLDAADNAESYARIVVTRGPGVRALALSRARQNRLVIIVRPLSVPPEQQYESGLQMAIAKIRRKPAQALDPALKTGNTSTTSSRSGKRTRSAPTRHPARSARPGDRGNDLQRVFSSSAGPGHSSARPGDAGRRHPPLFIEIAARKA